MDVAAIVVSFNTREILRGCLHSVRASGAHEVVVVDNASEDGSGEMVRKEFPEFTLIENETNQGYGAAANQAVALCTSPYVLVLNSDTLVSPDACTRLGGYLDAHPAAAVVGPLLVNADGTGQLSCFPFPGTLRWLVENDPIAPLAGRIPFLRQHLFRFASPTESQAVPWVLGAALAMRRDAFVAVGGFDESFFMYYEEVDLCWRLHEREWEVHYDPTTTVEHIGGASTSKRWKEMSLQHFASTLRFYRRHYKGAHLAVWLVIMRMKMLARLIRDTVEEYVESDPERQEQMRDRKMLWRRALMERSPDVAPAQSFKAEVPGA